MPEGYDSVEFLNSSYLITGINGIVTTCSAIKNFLFSVPQAFSNTYKVYMNRNHFIMEELYQRSQDDNISIAHVGLPFPGWPKIVVVGGSNGNVLEVAGYGEGETKDPEARFVFADVATMLGVKTIANLQGREATQQRGFLKQHIMIPSFDNALSVTQDLVQKGLAHWDYDVSFQHNICHIVVNILGKTVFGIPNVDSKYIPRIRKGASLLFGHSPASKEFIAAQNAIKAMNEELLTEHADAVLASRKYIVDQLELNGQETKAEQIKKLMDVRGASGLLVEGNVSGALMIALAHINESDEIKEALRAELGAYHAKKSVLTANDIKAQEHFPYLDCVYKEALRFLTPQAAIARKTSVPTTLRIEDSNKAARVYSIPGGSYLFAPIRSIHHDPRYWANPDVFDPNRFRGKTTRDIEYYTPFSIGPRSCPAVSGFAEIIIKAAILTAIPYDIHLNKKVEKIAVGTMHSHWQEEYSVTEIVEAGRGFSYQL